MLAARKAQLGGTAAGAAAAAAELRPAPESDWYWDKELDQIVWRVPSRPQQAQQAQQAERRPGRVASAEPEPKSASGSRPSSLAHGAAHPVQRLELPQQRGLAAAAEAPQGSDGARWPEGEAAAAPSDGAWEGLELGQQAFHAPWCAQGFCPTFACGNEVSGRV